MATITVNVSVFTPYPILAEGFVALVQSLKGLAIAAAYSTLREVVPSVEIQLPDVLVVEATGDVTLSWLAELRRVAGTVHVILWAGRPSPEFIFQALQLGVCGVLLQTSPIEAHIQCLQEVAAGRCWVEQRFSNDSALNFVELTARERQLLSLLSQGLHNREIAGRLGIAVGTVAVQLATLMRKTGTNDRFDLALSALKNVSSRSITSTLGAGADVLTWFPQTMALQIRRKPPVRVEQQAGFSSRPYAEPLPSNHGFLPCPPPALLTRAS